MSEPIVESTTYRPTLVLSQHAGMVYVSAYDTDGSGSHWQRLPSDPAILHAVSAWLTGIRKPSASIAAEAPA